MSEQAKADLFPIMPLGYQGRDEIVQLRAGGISLVVIGLPWKMIAPHEKQARGNHGGQSLKRLAERGGLSVCEAVAVLEDRRYQTMPRIEAHKQLVSLLAAYEATTVAAAAE